MSASRNSSQLSNEELIAELCLDLINNNYLSLSGTSFRIELYERLMKLESDEAKKLVNTKTLAGYSLIYYAVKTGNLTFVNTLIENGADLTMTYDGLTLRDIVQQELAKDPDNIDYSKIDAILENKNINYNSKKLEEFKAQIQDLDNSQSWLKNPLQKLGYKKAGGFCCGLAFMGAQAFLLEERGRGQSLIHLNKLTDRMKFLDQNKNIFKIIEISKHKRRLLINLAKIQINKDPSYNKLSPEEKQKKIEEFCQKRLSDHDKMALDMEPFFDGLEIYQQIYKHNQLLPEDEKRYDQAVIPGMKLVPNVELEKKGGAVIVDQFYGDYSKVEDLQALLSKIEKIAKEKQYQSPIVLVLGANKHAITIGYDPITETWKNIDANYPKMIAKVLNVNEIAKAVKLELQIGLDAKKLDLSINVLSTAANAENMQEKIVKPLRDSNEWKRTSGFWGRHKKTIAICAVCFLVGVGLFAASIFTAGLAVPAVVGMSFIGGSLFLGAPVPIIKIARSTQLETIEKNENAQALKTAVKDYQKKHYSNEQITEGLHINTHQPEKKMAKSDGPKNEKNALELTPLPKVSSKGSINPSRGVTPAAPQKSHGPH